MRVRRSRTCLRQRGEVLCQVELVPKTETVGKWPEKADVLLAQVGHQQTFSMVDDGEPTGHSLTPVLCA